ncbi:MAG TPA: hypothetical protein VF705_10750 [Longimicrobium sp.]|jgi:hypothetical protein
MDESAEIFVLVPGPWNDDDEFAEALARAGTGVELDGERVVEPGTGAACAIKLEGGDYYLRFTFESAGYGKFSPDVLDAIELHPTTAFLYIAAGYENARVIARLTSAVLRAGGIAPVVTSASVAHTRETWLEQAARDDPAALYHLFVRLLGAYNRQHSCGMHNFGLPDAAIPEALGRELAERVLHPFNLYQLTERPALENGATFAVDDGALRFRLTHGPDPEPSADSPLRNPFGVWMLHPIDAQERP